MRKFIKIHIAIIIILSSFSLVFGQSHKPFFKDGDTICFLGDSITHGGQYHEFLQLFYATRYPELNLSFHNCGISGDNASGMLARFEEDVMKHKPTHVFLEVGKYFETSSYKRYMYVNQMV